ncbi:hypothetical protein ACFW1A_06280 [Kitasatospora sp. NPDC058965]|uniref:hypothetical protein n=1 Tax=Kitasatospora sp. NPDC058965 TaxID=3346682 RepID=UPI0036972ED8
MEWFEQARAAEDRQDWDAAIALVSARAECYSVDDQAHDSHLWHLRLLADAGRLAELTELARTDVHARRRLNRTYQERGLGAELRERAAAGDRSALYCLLRMLGEAGHLAQARQAVAELAPENAYAHRVLEELAARVR